MRNSGSFAGRKDAISSRTVDHSRSEAKRRFDTLRVVAGVVEEEWRVGSGGITKGW